MKNSLTWVPTEKVRNFMENKIEAVRLCCESIDSWVEFINDTCSVTPGTIEEAEHACATVCETLQYIREEEAEVRKLWKEIFELKSEIHQRETDIANKFISA
jgi:hypothetical protein